MPFLPARDYVEQGQAGARGCACLRRQEEGRLVCVPGCGAQLALSRLAVLGGNLSRAKLLPLGALGEVMHSAALAKLLMRVGQVSHRLPPPHNPTVGRGMCWLPAPGSLLHLPVPA